MAQQDNIGSDNKYRDEQDKQLKSDDVRETAGDAGINDNDLIYNADEDSYELDIASDDPDYLHDDPYDSAAPGGRDDNSDWDEANPLVGDEYDENRSLETDLDSLGMHIDSGRTNHMSSVDEKLAETPEDERSDLDEEGYPKRDSN